MAHSDKGRAWFGWCMYDWANSGFATVIMAAVFPVYFASLVPPGGALLGLPGFSRHIPAEALWGYTVSLSMALVALCAPHLGALADRRGARRRFLILFTLSGAVATASLALAGPGDYLRAALFFMAANMSFAAANVFYNSFLPALAGPEELDRLSARGFAFGYIGGGLLLAAVFILIQWHGLFGFSGQGNATRFGLALTGLWWGIFAIPTFLLVREKNLPRPPGELLTGLRGYLRTFTQIRRYPDLLRFLIAFLFYNDGIQTVILVSAIFAKKELGLSTTSILGCFLMIQFVAMPGSLLFGRLAERLGSKWAVMTTLAFFTLATGFAFFIRHGWQFWLLGLVIALVLGGSQAISRSLYGSLIPTGKNAEFFGFYAISSKFASIFGPLIFALIADLTRSIRLSILSIAAFFLIGMILLARVDIGRGTALAREDNR